MIINILFSLVLISDSLTFSPFGVTAHGVSPGAPSLIKNKVDSSGVMASHPMASLLYRTGNLQLGASFLKDCFDNPAGSLMVGTYLPLGRFFTAGALIGPYIRKRAASVTTVTPLKNGQKETRVDFQKKLPLSLRTKSVEVAVMPLITLGAEIPITKQLGLELNVMSNGALNHFQMGIKWNFGGQK